MKIKNIELANISRYRGELMGIAMIFIFLFHVALPRSDMFFGLRRVGNSGVDNGRTFGSNHKILVLICSFFSVESVCGSHG